MSSRGPSLDGVLAAAAQVAAGELAAAILPGARSPLTGMGRAFIDMTPGPAVDITVALLEARDKPLLMATLLGGAAGVGALAGGLRESSRPALGPAALSGFGVLAGTGAASRPDAGTAGSLAAAAVGAAAGVAALELLSGRPRSRAAVVGLAAAAGVGARWLRARRTRALLERRARAGLPASSLPPPDDLGAPVEGISPLITPNPDFYETDITFPPPVVDLDGWALRVYGMVDRPLELDWRDLLDLGLEERDATLVCVHNPVGGPRIGTARWVGVPLARVLALAGVQGGADQVVARSVDGFTAGVPLSMVAEECASMIAVGMNGEPLPVGHGFPARLLTPGLYGYDANTKWLAELELTTFDSVADFWTRRGWPREPARVQPSARIDVPGDRDAVAPGLVTVAGVAWAPPRGVTGVQVSVNGGEWLSAELGEELDQATWRQWWLEIDLALGPHELRVRTDGQDPADGGSTPPYPHGSTGLHTITVRAGGRAPGRVATASVVADRRGRLAAQGATAWMRNYGGVRG